MYKPYKYGQIFKEKLFVGDNVPVSFHVNLTQTVKEESVDKVVPLNKDFFIEVLDNGELIQKYEGFNQISISHILLKSNAGLVEKPKEGV